MGMRFFALVLMLAPGPREASAKTVNEGIFAPGRLAFVLGQDGVTPIPVTFGDGEKRYLWTFGDTLLGNWTGPVATTATLSLTGATDLKAMPCNTLALSEVPAGRDHKNLSFAFYPGNREVSEFIRYNPGETPSINRLWADDGIQTPAGVYVFYMDVEIDKGTPAGFKFRGTGLAKSETPPAAAISGFAFERISGFSAKGLLLGDSAVERDGYIYVLGRLSKKADGNLNALCAARVKTARIEDLAAYEFLSREGRWQKNEKGAFFDDVSGEASLAYDEEADLFRIVYMSGNAQEIKLAEFRTFKGFARRPDAKSIYRPEPKKNIFYYSAKEIFQSKDAVGIIYMDPSIYQPILVNYAKPAR